MEWLIIIPLGFFLFVGFVALVLRSVAGEEGGSNRDGWTPDHSGHASVGGSGSNDGGFSSGADSCGGDGGGGCGGGD